VLVFALTAICIGELLDSVQRHGQEYLGLGEVAASWLSSWPTPPRPPYVVAAAGTALMVICACIQFTQTRAERLWVVALTATGQLAFTLYILHALAILLPLQHGWFEHASLQLTIGYAVAFYCVAIALSLWWRRRFPYGPLEALIRQITGRTVPAPWGGRLVSAGKD
jgi:uncharacterized membrane protein YeiB